ncbi:hypothetical protein [Vibrio sonorensis]|uniref:hypothetical protein n=1 Tax=Vibrio sonorensis TaxID=1004316 RepID=UPI0008DB0FF4|nr:hypothetical protein [Vibrio sonorensis]
MIPEQPVWMDTPVEGEQINSAAISQDGMRCVYGTSSEYDSGVFSVYCYDRSKGTTGTVLWSNPVTSEQIYQGVFWVAISGDGNFAAAGGETKKHGNDIGFLRAYDANSGEDLLSITLPSRVNQVALSEDGESLVAVHGDTISLYQLGSNGYQLSHQSQVKDYYLNSCVLTPKGDRVAISATCYVKEEGKVSKTIGKVLALNIDNGSFFEFSSVDLPVGSMRVAIADDGSYWGASLHDGSCAVFSADKPNEKLWDYKLPDCALSVAYGFDLTKTSDGKVICAVGVNLRSPRKTQDLGALYVVESVADKPELSWWQYIQYEPNPGISLDKEATYVTATDGKPDSHPTEGSVHESPGNFYLYSNSGKGELCWKYSTPIMNWPMVISSKGNAIVGASDTGQVFYWQDS